ncbi:helix-turn-helix domain-containing protein [Streptomyces sp. NPDC095602]|uniref:ArsR/SmtB family transcription factor n=1 Tax=Streptomyces sp. NPDC095602 TaxID=3155819 RepID=UPI003318DA37
MSRALLQAHLRKLEAAGLISTRLGISSEGKAMRFYQVTPFALHLTPETIAAAAPTLSLDTVHAWVARCYGTPAPGAKTRPAPSPGSGMIGS